MRDSRINLIFEGSSEIMRLFLAREALDPHLKVAGGALDSRSPAGRRLAAALKAGGFYALWYPRQFLPAGGVPADFTPALRPALAYVARTSRRLARTLFHAMAKHGPGLEKRQLLLGRVVDIGTELFALTAATLRADALIKRAYPAQPRAELEHLAGCAFGEARGRIAAGFAALQHNNDDRNYRLAQALLDGRHDHLRRGIVE